jgi:hypothetical protein
MISKPPSPFMQHSWLVGTDNTEAGRCYALEVARLV